MVKRNKNLPNGEVFLCIYTKKNISIFLIEEFAQHNRTEGIVKFQFLIDSDVNSSQIQEVVRIIPHGSKWIPAEQNNRKVKYRQVQAIHFRLD